MTNVEYGSIHSSDARTVQELILQDLEAGEFPYPKAIASPYSPKLVLRQAARLKGNPERYAGAYVDGKLSGFMKTSEWALDDELPFATEVEAQRIEELKNAGISTDPRRRLGIFGLMTSNRLETDLRTELTEALLDLSIDRALSLGSTAVNVIFHENDPVQAISRTRNFEFSGRMGEAAGASGIKQRLYTKLLDL